jgi:hypothetical protein
MSVMPSGEQVVLRYGDQRAVIVEVGGGLRECTVGGVPQDGYPFTLRLEVLYTLSNDGLSVQSTARNVVTPRAPFASARTRT